MEKLFSPEDAKKLARRVRAKYHADGIPEDASDDDTLNYFRSTYASGKSDEEFFEALDQLPEPAPAAPPKPAPSRSGFQQIGDFARDVAGRVGENVKQAVTHPVETAKNIVVETGKDIASIPGALQTLTEPGRIAALVAMKTQAPDSPAGQDAAKELDRLVRAGALSASVATGGLAGGLARGAIVKGALAGAAGMGTYSGVKAAGSGASAEEVAKETAVGSILGGTLGATGGAGARLLKKGGVRPGAPAPEAPRVPETTKIAGRVIEAPVHAPHPVVERLTAAIKAAEPVSKEQAKLISAERSKRLGAAMGAMEKIGGERGYHAALASLRGKMPQAQFESVRAVFNPAEIEELVNMAGRHPRLTGFEKINAISALEKVLGTDKAGALPTKGELSLLREVYGNKFVGAVLSKRTLLQAAGHELADVLNIPRTVMASFDMSAPLRQGILVSTRPEFYKNLAPMVRMFADEKYFNAALDQIEARPSFMAMREGGLAVGRMIGPEEAFFTRWAKKIPGVKHSERAYSGFLQKTRADVFDSVVKHAQDAGVDVADPAFLKSLGTWINTATGRGDLGKLGAVGNALGTAMFSPRLLASRLQTLNPKFYVDLDPFVRREAIKTHLSAAAAVTGLLGVASMLPGASVGLEPRSADFGKLRIGNTRFDLTGGFAQYPRIAAQLVSGKIISSTTGKEMVLGDPGKYRPMTHFDIILRFFENKMSPVASYVVGLLQHQNAIGQPFDSKQEALARFVPMIVGDVYDAMAEWGAKGALVAVPAFFGAGSQTYSGKPGTSGSSAKAAASFKAIGVKDGAAVDVTVRVPRERAAEFANEMQDAETKATQELVGHPDFDDLTPTRQESLLKGIVEKYRQQVRSRWLKANRVQIGEGARSGRAVELRSPEEHDVLQAMKAYNAAARSGDQRKIEKASAQVIRARAALVNLTSTEQAGLPAGLMPPREGVLGMTPDETARVAEALLPELEGAGVPATATPSEVVQFYWDQHAPAASPDEFKEFLRSVVNEQPAEQPAKPTEGAQLEEQPIEAAPVSAVPSAGITPGQAMTAALQVEPVDPGAVIKTLMRRGAKKIVRPTQFAQKATDHFVWIDPEGVAVSVAETDSNSTILMAQGYVKLRVGEQSLSAWIARPMTKEQSLMTERFLPNNTGLRAFSGRLVDAVGNEINWSSDLREFALAEPPAPTGEELARPHIEARKQADFAAALQRHLS